MININENKLNTFEKEIHGRLLEAAKYESDIKITRAAQICGCSVSKISKFVNKLGFKSYKQYTSFLYGKKIPQKKLSGEMERLRKFLDDFNQDTVDNFIDLIKGYDKIMLFGYGPSSICATYLEYKLRIVTNKTVLAPPDEISVINTLDDKTILIIFTTTGKFKSFAEFAGHAADKKSGFALVVEEYNTSLLNDCKQIFFLTNDFQEPDLLPHEKSRTVFFIFIEEVIRRFIEKQKNNPR